MIHTFCIILFNITYEWFSQLPLCTSYSDGSAGNLTLDASGILSLNGNTNDPRFSNSTTLGTAPDVVTTFDDINNFIIAPGQTVNVLGTLIVKSKLTQIDGELNGNGGGYAGGAAKRNNGNPGESPLDTNGHGRGGKSSSGTLAGGGGGSHGKLLFLCHAIATANVILTCRTYFLLNLIDM